MAFLSRVDVVSPPVHVEQRERLGPLSAPVGGGHDSDRQSVSSPGQGAKVPKAPARRPVSVDKRLPEAHLPKAMGQRAVSGTQAVYLARQGWDVTAIDGVPRPLSQARARADTAGVKVD